MINTFFSSFLFFFFRTLFFLFNFYKKRLPLNRVMDSIKPLLALIRTSKDNLMEYEGLMALTNVLSMSSNTSPKDRFVTLRGISAVEYCQFSHHPQVSIQAKDRHANGAL